MLDDIAERLGGLTDKFRLGYFPAYRQFAEEIGPEGRVLEVGVYRGGSLMMWQELFPSGLVAGADHSPYAMWPSGTVRIIADQADPELAKAAEAASPEGYDLIVDDASHKGSLSSETFRLLWPLVRPGGWYVLEDWAVGYLPEEILAAVGTSRALLEGDSMLRLAESFLPMLGNDSESSEIDELRYRYGQAMIHRRVR